MKLSILICSLESRREDLKRLIHSIVAQHYISLVPQSRTAISPSLEAVELIKYTSDQVEIIIARDNKETTVGAKRNLLIEQASGDYIAFIDDDDRVTDDYIEYLLRGIEKGLDSVCFQVMYNPAGGTPKLVKYSANMYDIELKTHFERSTNHLMCIKREIANRVKFKNINFGEDAIWARQVCRHIKSEVQIDKVLYYYDFDHGKSETQ